MVVNYNIHMLGGTKKEQDCLRDSLDKNVFISDGALKVQKDGKIYDYCNRESRTVIIDTEDPYVNHEENDGNPLNRPKIESLLLTEDKRINQAIWMLRSRWYYHMTTTEENRELFNAMNTVVDALALGKSNNHYMHNIAVVKVNKQFMVIMKEVFDTDIAEALYFQDTPEVRREKTRSEAGEYGFTILSSINNVHAQMTIYYLKDIGEVIDLLQRDYRLFSVLNTRKTKYLFCSTNQSKINEMKEYSKTFKETNIEILIPEDLGLEVPSVEEGDLFTQENASIKADFYANWLAELVHTEKYDKHKVPDYIFCDDTGLYISGAMSFPGALAARTPKAKVFDVIRYCHGSCDNIETGERAVEIINGLVPAKVQSSIAVAKMNNFINGTLYKKSVFVHADTLDCLCLHEERNNPSPEEENAGNFDYYVVPRLKLQDSETGEITDNMRTIAELGLQAKFHYYPRFTAFFNKVVAGKL